MSLQPKTRKYRLCFRNKTRIYKNLPIDVRIRKLRKNLPPILHYLRPSVQKSALYRSQTATFGTRFFVPKASGVSEQIFKDYLNIRYPEICSTTLNRKSLSNFTDRVSQISMLTKRAELSHNFATLRSNSKIPQEPLKFKLNKSSLLISEQMDSASGCWKIFARPMLPLESIATNPLTSSQKSLTMTPHTSSTIDKVRFGACGFYFCSSGTISAKFIDTIRLIVARKLKKAGRFWIRVCPDTPVTARSAETRMGRGKGAISHYEAKVRPGQMFMEFSGVPEESVRQIYQQVLKKTAIPITLLY